jgi:hypothetical protein
VVRNMALKNVFRFMGTSLVFFACTFGAAQAGQELIGERLVSIEVKDQYLSQVLEGIADQVGVAIILRGSKPDHKRDISLNRMPLEKAISQVMWAYGLENHASVYYPETETILLAVLKISTQKMAFLPPGSENGEGEVAETKFLTPAEFALLESESPEDSKTLTPGEFAILTPEPSRDIKTLTSAEFSRLRSEEPDGHKTLTAEEYSRLEQESPEDFKTLTAKEFSRLKDALE